MALCLVAAAHVHLADATGHGHAEVSEVTSLDDKVMELLQTNAGGAPVDIPVDKGDMDEPITDSAKMDPTAEEPADGDSELQAEAQEEAKSNAPDEAPDFVSKFGSECESPAETAAREKEEKLAEAAAALKIQTTVTAGQDGDVEETHLEIKSDKATPTPCPKAENDANEGGADPIQNMPGSVANTYAGDANADLKKLQEQMAKREELEAEQQEAQAQHNLVNGLVDKAAKVEKDMAPPPPFSPAAIKQAGDLAIKALPGNEHKDSVIVNEEYEADIEHSKQMAIEDKKRTEAMKAAAKDREDKDYNKAPDVDEKGRIETKREMLMRLHRQTIEHARRVEKEATIREATHMNELMKTHREAMRETPDKDPSIPKGHDDSEDPESSGSISKDQVDKAFSGDKQATKHVVKRVLDAAKSAHEALSKEPDNLELIQVREDPVEEAEEEKEASEVKADKTQDTAAAIFDSHANKPKSCICKKKKAMDIPAVDMTQGMPEQVANDYIDLTKSFGMDKKP